jgi:hypothetical protein
VPLRPAPLVPTNATKTSHSYFWKLFLPHLRRMCLPECHSRSFGMHAKRAKACPSLWHLSHLVSRPVQPSPAKTRHPSHSNIYSHSHSNSTHGSRDVPDDESIPSRSEDPRPAPLRSCSSATLGWSTSFTHIRTPAPHLLIGRHSSSVNLISAEASRVAIPPAA